MFYWNLQKFVQELESKTSLGINTFQEHLEQREFRKVKSDFYFLCGKRLFKNLSSRMLLIPSLLIQDEQRENSNDGSDMYRPFD
jgi:hypothetical protein